LALDPEPFDSESVRKVTTKMTDFQKPGRTGLSKATESNLAEAFDRKSDEDDDEGLSTMEQSKQNPNTALRGEDAEKMTESLKQLVRAIISKYQSDIGSSAASKISADFDNVINRVFQPHTGTENFTNLRTPGTAEPKVIASPGNSGSNVKGPYQSNAKVMDDSGHSYSNPTSLPSATPDRTRGSSYGETGKSGQGSSGQYYPQNTRLVSGGRTTPGMLSTRYGEQVPGMGTGTAKSALDIQIAKLMDSTPREGSQRSFKGFNPAIAQTPQAGGQVQEDDEESPEAMLPGSAQGYRDDISSMISKYEDEARRHEEEARRLHDEAEGLKREGRDFRPKEDEATRKMKLAALAAQRASMLKKGYTIGGR